MPWLKPKIIEKVVEKEILVPIATSDSRSLAEKWEDEKYLVAVKNMAANEVFVTEGFEALKAMRLIADEAKTPEELVGIQKCIRVLRALVTAPERAKRKLDFGEKLNAISNEAE